MSHKISNLVNILKIISKLYVKNKGKPIEEHRIMACKKFAEKSKKRYQSFLDVCREQFGPEIVDIKPFDTLVTAWLKQGNLSLMEIALKHSADSRDEKLVRSFFGTSTLHHYTQQDTVVFNKSTVTTPGIAELITAEESGQAFEPSSIEDSRERIASSIVRRRGQPDFRKKMIRIYYSRCAISGSDAKEALEAAHIIPYRGAETNNPSNGILLRADLHVLFDLGLISVDTETMTVVVAKELHSTSYKKYHGKPLQLPTNDSEKPSIKALDIHRRDASL